MDDSEATVDAEEDMFERELRLGHHQDLVPELLRAVDAEPLRERLWRQLMLAEYRCGRQTDALRAFQRMRNHLLDETGQEPSAESFELEKAIATQKPELDWVGPESITY